jgi:hypothetical protein
VSADEHCQRRGAGEVWGEGGVDEALATVIGDAEIRMDPRLRGDDGENATALDRAPPTSTPSSRVRVSRRSWRRHERLPVRAGLWFGGSDVGRLR